MTGASDAEARDFAIAFRAFLEWVHSGAEERDQVAELVSGFLGQEAVERSVVTRSMPVFEHVNLQTALDAWTREPGREVAVQGLTLPPHYGGVTLQQLVSGDGHGALQLSAPPLVDLPNGPGSTLACLRLGLLPTLRDVDLIGDARAVAAMTPGGGFARALDEVESELCVS